jgi:hypothetical protein
MGIWHAPMDGRPSGRCPVQPSTLLGPDQVNVLLLRIIIIIFWI